MQIRIHTAKNGFIVYPLLDEIASLSHQPKNTYTMNNDEVMVFEAFEGLAKYLKEYFGPLVEVTKTPAKPAELKEYPGGLKKRNENENKQA